MAEFKLYTYQEEVVQRALRGENTIIWMPTGGGKTRAAAYVAKRHLQDNPKGKVVLIANMIHLVDQHHDKEFQPLLGREHSVMAVSGNRDEKDFFGKVLQDNDVVICTAQILYNALTDEEEGKHAELSDITLLIVDECHHTDKESVYNKIMRSYVEKKLRGERRLPQILGLTASPGAGKAKCLDQAVDHVLQICANLDSAIVSTKDCVKELREKVPRPRKELNITLPRPKDPFGNHVKWMMQQIHDCMLLPRDITLREFGTQEYECDVVELKKTGVTMKDRILVQCALHLREYNDVLLINDTLRMVDALRSLEEFYAGKEAFDGTDHFLLGLFQENRSQLRTFALDPQYENPKMAKLEETLLNQFGPDEGSRGILFSKTRKSTHCLTEWVTGNSALQEAGINASSLTGAGNGITYMTQNEQSDTITRFRRGSLNLLIATSVAEEGLDIPECNLVVRYGLLTNEIAQQQASGRARTSGSTYSVVAQQGGRELNRESLNEHLEDLSARAIAKIQEMSDHDFRAKIAKLQREAILVRRAADQRRQEKRGRYQASEVQLLCQGCFLPVASGSDIKLVEASHHVNINPDFKKHYRLGGPVMLGKSFEDWEPGRRIICNNTNCSKEWGFEIKYKAVALLPNIAINNFALETPEGTKPVKKWKDVPFTVEKFDFEDYCRDNHPDLFD